MVPARSGQAQVQPLQQIIAQRGQQARTATRHQAPPPRAQRTQPQSTLSPLAQALEARGRRFRIFPYPGLKSGYVGILYASGRDVEAALFRAHTSLAEVSAKGADSLRHDAIAIAIAKQREILFALCKGALDENRLRLTADGLHTYDAFPSTRWMAQWLSPDDEAALMALVAEVRAEFAPRGSVAADEWLDAEQLDAMAALLTDGADLAHLGRAEVTSLCVALARRLVDVTKARDALLDGAP